MMKMRMCMNKVCMGVVCRRVGFGGLRMRRMVDFFL